MSVIRDLSKVPKRRLIIIIVFPSERKLVGKVVFKNMCIYLFATGVHS
jgi:hypothetical protein